MRTSSMAAGASTSAARIETAIGAGSRARWQISLARATVPHPARAARKKKVGRKSRMPSWAGVGSIRSTGKVRKWTKQ